MNIVILGPQGSGKGTQAELISVKYGLEHVETGKLLREISSTIDNPLSKEVKKILNEGRLVPDVILEKVLKKVLGKSSTKGFIFDGTPRNIEQYDLMEKMLADRGEDFDAVILINISEDESIKRLSSRRTCVRCGKVFNTITKPSPNGNLCDCGGELIQRDDDKPQTIRKRLKEYHDKTSAVISRSRNEGILYEVDGERPIEKIFKDITKIIDKIDGQNKD